MLRILVAGDLHIGRCSTRLPVGQDSLAHAAAAAWQRLVDLALTWPADLLLLTGDVADHANRFWEAIGPLEQGINRLGQAHIRTLAVAGNHDHDVLGRLADQLDPQYFTLLGRGQRWQRITIERNDTPVLHIDGWSFARQHVQATPLADYDPPHDPATPTLAMVHGDLDQPSSNYAPLRLDQLQAAPVAGWLLGHIHTPRLIQSDQRPPVLYPGSTQALDPAEPGPRGAWQIQLEAGQWRSAVHVPLSSVRYETLDIDLSECQDASAVETNIMAGLRDLAAQIVGTHGEHLQVLSCRLRLTGRTSLAAQLPSLVNKLAADLQLSLDNLHVCVEKLDIHAMPDVDLAAHARGQTALGALARLLIELDKPQPDRETAQLLVAARNKILQIRQRQDYLTLPQPDPPDDQHTRSVLREQAAALLGQLLAQVE